MYMLFIYVNGKTYNTMGIRGSLEEVNQMGLDVSKEVFKLNPHATIETKVTMYI